LSRPATIDFETKSEVSLKVCGTWRYSVDPSTRILCLAYRLPHWAPGRTGLWHPRFEGLGIRGTGADGDFRELLAWIVDGRLVEAHNAFFERCIWGNIAVPIFGWPVVGHEQWRCSAAKAAAMAFPRGLDDALAALGSDVRKDAAGGKVMMRMTKPRRSRKKEREEWDAEGKAHPVVWHEDRVSLERLFAYCRQDVLAEEALSAQLPDLSRSEQSVYHMDQMVNLRGFQLDPMAVSTALNIIGSETARLNQDLHRLSDGAVSTATQRAKLIAWLATQGVSLSDTTKETVATVLSEPWHLGSLTDTARSGLEILQQLGKSSTAKYKTMQAQMDPTDHRVRGGLLYHGASTGRWSGSGVQPHNFPKGKLKRSMEETWDAILRGDVGDLPMDLLSSALRGCIQASDGHCLYVADYASIEARVLVWLAGDDDAVARFRDGVDPYLDMASEIYGYPCNKKDHPSERALGKVAILGLGYQMGVDKFIDTALVMGGVTIDEDLSRQTVEAYRRKYWRVKQMWWEMQEAAIQAVMNPKESVEMDDYRGVTWQMDGRWLMATLPSGRRLAYPDPQVKATVTPWGETRPALTYMGVNAFNRKWMRQHSYGGLLVENLVQAISRDLMADALLRAESSRIYAPVLSVHDEIVAEAKIGTGSVHEFEQLMVECPPWAADCPVAAEGWTGQRYHK
jgi:DNA polymerase bacteriophage-type